MIWRTEHVNTVSHLLKTHRVVGMIGPRQIGKTTLARLLMGRWTGQKTFLDLENPEDFARLQDPMLYLKPLQGMVILDEIQRLPDLFAVLRVLVDRPRNTTRFLILGSASPALLRQGSESLAGRIIYHALGGFSVKEVGVASSESLWFRGSFPRSYLARSHAESFEWRRGFIRTFLERDLPQLGINLHSTTLHRFWTMLAHYHGQTWNASEFGRSFGVADTTVRHYLDTLTSAMVIRQLPAWHENISKRQVKAPKVFLADSGLLHVLLNVRRPSELQAHPKVGASWEGFVIQQTIQMLGAAPEDCFFWATHAGAELDLLIVRGSDKFGFEVKRTSSPKLTRSMRQALEDLHLKRLDVIHAGDQTFPMDPHIRAVAFSRMLHDRELLSARAR